MLDHSNNFVCTCYFSFSATSIYFLLFILLVSALKFFQVYNVGTQIFYRSTNSKILIAILFISLFVHKKI